MHLNFHFLQHLSQRLNHLLTGSQFVEAFSQEKDELVLILKLKNGAPFYIKASLTSSFSCLSFPNDFRRSRKNSVNLFQQLEDNSITEVYQFQNERAFVFRFKAHFSLLFKLHGNRSNIILFEDDQATSLFKNKLVKDKEIHLSNLDRKLDHSFDLFRENPDVSVHFPTYGKAVKPWLEHRGFSGMKSKEQWQLLLTADEEMKKGLFYICLRDSKPQFTLLKNKECEEIGNDPIKAINEFFYRFSKTYFFENKKAQAIKELSKRKKQLNNYIQKSELSLKSLLEGPQPKELGDILMANLHSINTGQTKVVLHNFYTDAEVTIKLNNKLSPQKNAENYYRKSKNRKIEENQIKVSIKAKETSLIKIDALIEAVNNCATSKDIDNIIKGHGQGQLESKPQVSLPYKEFAVAGFRVWVGKNAKANDQLTLKHTYKEDLWFHAKDVPGSHVVIKHESNRPFDIRVIERVAEIAAYYSKRKTDSLAPVIYTPAKFVRKRKGSPAGAVIVEKEKVLIVPPRGPEAS